MRFDVITLLSALLAALLIAALQPPAAYAQLPSIAGNIRVENATLTFIVYSDGGVQVAYSASGTANITVSAAALTPLRGVSLVVKTESVVNKTRLEKRGYLLVTGLSVKKGLSLSIAANGSLSWGPGVNISGVVAAKLPIVGWFNASYSLGVNGSTAVGVFTGVDCRVAGLLAGLVPGLNATCSNHVLRVELELGRFYAWLRSRGLSDTEIAALEKLLREPYRVHGAFELNATLKGGRLVYAYAERLEGRVARLVVDEARASYALYHAMVVVLHRVAERIGEERLASQLARAEQALSLLAAPPKLLPKPPYRAHAILYVNASHGVYRFRVEYLSEKRVYAAEGLPPDRLAKKTLTTIAESLLQLRMALSLLSTSITGAENLIPFNVTVKPGDACVKVEPVHTTLDQINYVVVQISCKSSGKKHGATHGTGTSRPSTRARTETQAGIQTGTGGTPKSSTVTAAGGAAGRASSKRAAATSSTVALNEKSTAHGSSASQPSTFISSIALISFMIMSVF